MNFTELVRSKVFMGIVISVAGVALLMVVFAAGMTVGEHRADFAYRWGEEYHHNFGGPGGGFMPGAGPIGAANPHATFGKIVRITLPTISVASGDAEKVVVLSDDTIIRRLSSDATPADLRVGDQVVVLGEPNSQAQITATFIRIMPAGTTSPTVMPMMSPR